MPARVSVIGVVLLSMAAPAMAQTIDAQADSYCRGIGARGPDYRECRVLIVRTYSNDPYFAANARARLMYLEQHLFDRARRDRENPDLTRYGASPEEYGPRRGFGCVTMGDGLGGGITDCE